MLIRRLYTAYALLNFLACTIRVAQQIRPLADGARTFSHAAYLGAPLCDPAPARPSALIGCLGRHLVTLRQPWAAQGHAAAVDSTPLRANGGVWHKKHRLAGEVPHTPIDTRSCLE